MKRTDLPKRFQALLHKVPYVTIATVCKNGQPWNTPIVGHFDDELNLYFITAKKSQHARNIASEPQIFVVVYDSGVPLGQGEGLYLQMRARAVKGENRIHTAKEVAHITFAEHIANHEEFGADCPRRLYKATLQRLWYNGDGEENGHVIDVRFRLAGA